MRNDEAIEGVPVVELELAEGEDVIELDAEELDVVALTLDDECVMQRGLEFAELPDLDLDLHLPGRDDAHQSVVAPVAVRGGSACIVAMYRRD